VVASERPPRRMAGAGKGLNPRHCGAVVASSDEEVRVQLQKKSQSPSLRGSGRFIRSPPAAWRRGKVSIPFIAGQWSLHVPDLWIALQAVGGLNPLHCGAVVASSNGRSRKRRPALVSIPFIAGQWSLQEAARERAQARASFNPLHCGAVVASRSGAGARAGKGEFQSPSLRGSGRFARRDHGHNQTSLVLIPFIAGQWSLRRGGSQGAEGGRGLNPLHCGAVVASWWRSAGAAPEARLNPLHCGAVVASGRRGARRAPAQRVLIPFIAGQWSLLQKVQGDAAALVES